jgi:hypothetical protein
MQSLKRWSAVSAERVLPISPALCATACRTALALQNLHSFLDFVAYCYETRIWSDKYYPERQVSGIYSKRDLEKLFNIMHDRTPLGAVKVNDDISNRYYQKEAIQAVCDAFDDRNRRKALHTLMQNGQQVEYGEKIGKTIIFAKNHNHAEKILEVWNKEFPDYPGHYARVIDNYAQSPIDDFSDKSKMPQIAISSKATTSRERPSSPSPRPAAAASAKPEYEMTENFTLEDIRETLRPIASLTSKSEKARTKLTPGTWQHTRRASGRRGGERAEPGAVQVALLNQRY